MDREHYYSLTLATSSRKHLCIGLVSVRLSPIFSPNLQYICTHTHPFNGPFSGTTQVSRYQKGQTNLDFTEARDSEWQWHQLGHMQVCTSLQTASTPPLCFLQAGCPSCRPTNSVKALKANQSTEYICMLVYLTTKYIMYPGYLWICGWIQL